MHAIQGLLEVSLVLEEGDGLEACRNGDLTADGVLQQLLIEALDRRQDGNFPLGIFGQTQLPRTNALSLKKIATLVKTKWSFGTSLPSGQVPTQLGTGT